MIVLCDQGGHPVCDHPDLCKRGRKLCPNCMNEWYEFKNPYSQKFRLLKSKARKRGLPFDLTLSWLQDFLARHQYRSGEHHIDRINPAGGYTKDNIQILTAFDNCSKGSTEDRKVVNGGMFTPSSKYKPITPIPKDLWPF